MNPIGLYIHVPFCAKKCPYCNFYSTMANKKLMDDFTKITCRKIEYFGKKLKREADTLYFGGGTPSILGTDRILEILNCSKKYFKLNNSEITLEINPTSKNFLNFNKIHSKGINRLSIGLQSSNNDELKALGRSHTADIAKNTVRLAQDAGFNNISLDLMISIQGQTKNSLFESIKFCSELKVQHISAYILSIEKGTEYFKNRKILKLKNEEEQVKLYLFAYEELKKFGFNQYEISNFSKNGFESKHNLKYWNAEEYLGIGPSAHSFIKKERFYFKNDINSYLKENKIVNDGNGGDPEEYSLLRLRLSSGLTEQEYFARFNKSIPKRYFDNAKIYEKYGLLKIDENKSINLTTNGFLVSNELISKIIN